MDVASYDFNLLVVAVPSVASSAAKLVIAKLDRLSRNLALIATMMDSGVEFVAVDNPHANKLTLHVLAAVAQHEREMIAERTKAALKAAKHRGRVLGRNAKKQLAPRYKQEAIARANELKPLLRELSGRGLSSRAIARDLTTRKIPTPKGRSWHVATVQRMLHRIEFGCVNCVVKPPNCHSAACTPTRRAPPPKKPQGRGETRRGTLTVPA
jgi:Resolvase, N terminal domain/Recombinase